MWEAGDCLLRIRDLVARHFLRTRWGIKVGMDASPASLDLESICELPERGREKSVFSWFAPVEDTKVLPVSAHVCSSSEV
jgi:hypothetical protein